MVVPVPFVCSALLCLMDMLPTDDGVELLVFLSRVAKCCGRHASSHRPVQRRYLVRGALWHDTLKPSNLVTQFQEKIFAIAAKSCNRQVISSHNGQIGGGDGGGTTRRHNEGKDNCGNNPSPTRNRSIVLNAIPSLK